MAAVQKNPWVRSGLVLRLAGEIYASKQCFSGDREAVRKQAIEFAIEKIVQLI